MNPYGVLAAAAADWDRLAPLLSPAALRRLASLLRDVRSNRGGAEQLRAVEEAAALLLEALRGAPDRPSDGDGDGNGDGNGDGEAGGRFAGTAEDLPHLGFRADDLLVLVLDGHRMVGPVLGPVRERLLAAPALDDTELRLLGGDPDAPGPVALTGANGRRSWPSFQFGAGGRPLPAVLEANAVLDARRDPWGAADWWLSPNAWLGVPPADLLGTGREGQLVDAARYLAEGE
ncbi:hypothetical protein ACIQF6_26745 [Kitasatospora sp. NPDC092948]|uniref:hypothetical protein n=1 Tax=Kitasatospora sp. NPDC092948 TaxID=3364088 RepID=UPI003821E548